jgi:hypothetical protein
MKQTVPEAHFILKQRQHGRVYTKSLAVSGRHWYDIYLNNKTLQEITETSKSILILE